MNVNAQRASALPFRSTTSGLDRLMDEAGIDVLLATSKHNVQYLLGGHRVDLLRLHGCDRHHAAICRC